MIVVESCRDTFVCGIGTKIIHSNITPPPPPPPPHSRDHRKLFVGDALGRIFSWTVSDNLGKCMEDKGQRCSLYCLGWGECVMISSSPFSFPPPTSPSTLPFSNLSVLMSLSPLLEEGGEEGGREGRKGGGREGRGKAWWVGGWVGGEEGGWVGGREGGRGRESREPGGRVEPPGSPPQDKVDGHADSQNMSMLAVAMCAWEYH